LFILVKLAVFEYGHEAHAKGHLLLAQRLRVQRCEWSKKGVSSIDVFPTGRAMHLQSRRDMICTTSLVAVAGWDAGSSDGCHAIGRVCGNQICPGGLPTEISAMAQMNPWRREFCHTKTGQFRLRSDELLIPRPVSSIDSSLLSTVSTRIALDSSHISALNL
jgi:hypothetical protein